MGAIDEIVSDVRAQIARAPDRETLLNIRADNPTAWLNSDWADILDAEYEDRLLDLANDETE